MKKEAPLVWSYTTSQAYHEERGDPAGPARRYRALIFDEGQPLQVEGVALVKGTLDTPGTRPLARQFLEFMISAEVQSRIPLGNWMLPVLPTDAMPVSFKNLPVAGKIVSTKTNTADVEKSLQTWKRAIDSAAGP